MLGEDMYYPRQVAWIKTTTAGNKRMLPEDLITENEIIKMLKATRNPRDKAIIALLFDAGIRAGELLGLRKKDIDFNSEPVHITVNGKTGMRQIPIMFSVPYVSKYIEIMDDLGATDPLWKDLGSRSNGDKSLNQSGLNMMLKKVCKRAGVEKRIYAHLFRHSRASNYANKLTEQQLKAFFGWTGGSRMAATYVHLSGRDIDDAVLQANGMKPKEQDKTPTLTIKVCPRCRKVNDLSSIHCSTCGSALDIATVMKEKELENKAEELAARAYDKKKERADTVKKVREKEGKD
jgi:integrase/recombinase XerD